MIFVWTNYFCSDRIVVDGDRSRLPPEKGGDTMKLNYGKWSFWISIAQLIGDIVSTIIDFIFG